MQTELKSAWRSGFKLTEKEFRRIIDLMVEKIKTHPEQTVLRKIKYKLANGAIIDTQSVEDLFSEENAGTKRIVAISMEFRIDNGMSSEMAFNDLISEREEKNSIFYKLTGEVRDPLFVLASELDERIGHIKQVNVWPERSLEFIMLTVMLSMTTIMASTLFSLTGSNPATKAVIAAYNAGNFSPDFQGLSKLIVQFEEARAAHDISVTTTFLPFAALIVIPVIAAIIWLFIKNFLYPFNFVWGEQIGVVERRDRRKSFIIIGVGVAIIIGIFSSYIAGLLPRF